jgi:hypothetical protein
LVIGVRTASMMYVAGFTVATALNHPDRNSSGMK